MTPAAEAAASERFRRLIGRLTAVYMGGERGAGGGTVNSRDSAMVPSPTQSNGFCDCSVKCGGVDGGKSRPLTRVSYRHLRA